MPQDILFETQRPSEVLNFTLQEAVHLDDDFLRGAFGEIGEWIYE